MTVRHVKTATFDRDVLRSEQPVVVDFYADWCGPCHQIAPILERLAVEWDGQVRFARVNIDTEPKIAAAYRISSIPALVKFVDGKPEAWSVGVKPGFVLERSLKLRPPRVGSGGIASRLLARLSQGRSAAAR